MNRLYLLLVICVAILGGGCGPAAKDQLVGRWQGTIELSDEKMQEKLNESTNPLQQLAAQALINGLKKGSMDVEFKSDGTFSQSMKLGPFSKDADGTWRVSRKSGRKVIIEFSDSDGNKSESTLIFAGNDTFIIDVDGEASEYVKFRCRRVVK